MARLTRNGRDLPERILLRNTKTLNSGIAVANVLKILAENDPVTCLRDWGPDGEWGNDEKYGPIVKSAKINKEFTKISIEEDGGKVEHEIRPNFVPSRDISHERCLVLEEERREGFPFEEAYFILNPHPENKTLDRLVVKCMRYRQNLIRLVGPINEYCRKSPLKCLQGIEIGEE